MSKPIYCESCGHLKSYTPPTLNCKKVHNLRTKRYKTWYVVSTECSVEFDPNFWLRSHKVKLRYDDFGFKAFKFL